MTAGAAKAAAPRIEIDTTREKLVQLGLEYAAEQLAELLSVAVRDNQPPHRVLHELLSIEHARREERRIKTALRLSGLPLGQTFETFDWSFQPETERGSLA